MQPSGVRSRGKQLTLFEINTFDAVFDAIFYFLYICQSVCAGPMPRTLQRLARVVQSILNIIECPICFETIRPPALQCRNGHLLCVNCRIRAEKCPICRDFLTPNPVKIAEKLYKSISGAFDLCHGEENHLRQRIFGNNSMTTNTTFPIKTRTNSHINRIQSK